MPETQTDEARPAQDQVAEYDAIVISAGISGMFMLLRLRDLGMTTRVFEMGVRDMAQAEAEYPRWLGQLLTHRVKGLENYPELFEKLTSAKGAIKVFCEVADL